MTFKGQIATCDFCGARTDRAHRDGWRWFGSSRRSTQRFPQDRDMCARCVERALDALHRAGSLDKWLRSQGKDA